MGKFKDLTGFNFGRWTVLSRADYSQDGHIRWRCRCTCGVERNVIGKDLTSGHSLSCGCLRTERTSTHSKSSDAIYSIWKGIIRRCTKPNHPSFKRYGGRGISVCERWLVFKNFYDDVSKLEHFGEKGYTLDRIDNNGNYELGNVRWADKETQARNQSRNIIVEYNGEPMTLMEASELSGINYNTLRCRYRTGDSFDEMFRPVARTPKSDLVFIENNQAITTSLIIAEKFNKRHDNVIQAIENELDNLLKIKEMLPADNNFSDIKIDTSFIKSTYKDSYGRLQPMYYLNRDAFSLIVMGFTGIEATKWKWRYIQAFNAMEQALTRPVKL